MARLNLTIDTKWVWLVVGILMIGSIAGYAVAKDNDKVSKEGTYNITVDKKVDDYVKDKDIDVSEYLEEHFTEDYDKEMEEKVLEEIAYIDNDLDVLEELVKDCTGYKTKNYNKTDGFYYIDVEVSYYDDEWNMVNETIKQEMDEEGYREELISYITENPDDLKLNCIKEVKIK